MKVRFYGSSDDNFCWDVLEGGRGSDEIGCYNCAAQARLSNGVVIEGEYSPAGYSGKWRIRVVADPGVTRTHFTHVPAADEDDNYSDELTIEGDFDSVKPVLSRDELEDKIGDFSARDCRGISDENLNKAAELLGII